MPIHYSFDSTRARLVTRADGVVTFHEINAHLDMEQRKRDLELPELFDARGATTDLTAAQVRRLVDRVTKLLRAADLGATAVVTNDPALFGLARMYAALAKQSGVWTEVFQDVAAASRWLDGFGPQAD